MPFAEQVKAWTVNVGKAEQAVVDEVTVDLLETLRDRTPVESGALRADWKVKKESNRTYIYNDMPYMATIEYGLYPNPAMTGTKTISGFSTQAPHGVIGITAVEAPAKLSAAVKKVKG